MSFALMRAIFVNKFEFKKKNALIKFTWDSAKIVNFGLFGSMNLKFKSKFQTKYFMRVVWGSVH